MGQKKESKSIIILGSGIGGLSAALELLERGFVVSIIEKNDKPGGIMQSIHYEDFIVEIGFRRYYGRIPEVFAFFKKVLGKDFIPYEHRIGVLYENKIFEREYTFRGYSRGLSALLIFKGMVDLIFNRVKYLIVKPSNFEQSTYAIKGSLFSKIFAQSYYEKLKGRMWNSLPPDYKGERCSTKKNLFSNSFARRVKQKFDEQYLWYHPRLGSFSLINAIYKNVKDHGAKFIFNTEVMSFSKQHSGKWMVNFNCNGVTSSHEADILISALPIEISSSLLFGSTPKQMFKIKSQRNVLIIYLFLDQKTLFPHNCLRVTDDTTLIARITNYGSYNLDMVPNNKGCLGIEIFCSNNDSILKYEDSQLLELAIEYCTSAKLIIPSSIIHRMVCKYFNTEVASSWEDYREDQCKMNLFLKMSETPDFYQINRTGIDKTIYASIKAAEAIEDGNQIEYNMKTAPNVNRPWTLSE